MNIICFLHSNGDTGEYLGFEGISDIFSFNGCCLELMNEDFNQAIKECIPADRWTFIKDNVFNIRFTIEDDGLPCPTHIELITPVYGFQHGPLKKPVDQDG